MGRCCRDENMLEVTLPVGRENNMAGVGGGSSPLVLGSEAPQKSFSLNFSYQSSLVHGDLC